MIEIYGKPGCAYCTRVMTILKAKGIPYDYKQLGEDFTMEDLMILNPEARAFPQIVLDGELIGGFNDFAQRLPLIEADFISADRAGTLFG